MSEFKPVRLCDIAEACGLSPSGVSRALNGDPTMSFQTQARVKKLAEKMGYHANPAARSLRDAADGGRSSFRGTIGYLVPDHAVAQMREPSVDLRFPWHGEIRRRASSYGYAVDVLEFKDEARGDSALNRVLRARGIQGVIVAASHKNLKTCGLDWKRLSAVSLYASPTDLFLTNLSMPYFQDAYLATQKLLQRGYTRIGLVMVGNLLDPFIGGYEVALQRENLPVFPVLQRKEGIPAGLKAWIKKHRLDCILTSTGLELVRALESMGLRVPRDIGLCVTDDIDQPGYLSGMAQPRVLVSRWAVDTLHTQLSHHEYGPPEEPAQIQFPSVWSEGQTLRRLTEHGSPEP